MYAVWIISVKYSKQITTFSYSNFVLYMLYFIINYFNNKFKIHIYTLHIFSSKHVVLFAIGEFVLLTVIHIYKKFLSKSYLWSSASCILSHSL